MRSSQQVVATTNTACVGVTVDGWFAWQTTSQIETSLLTPQHCNIYLKVHLWLHALKDFHFEKLFHTDKGQAATHTL